MKRLWLIAALSWAAAVHAANPMVQIRTNMGNITLELFADQAPQTVANFMRYVNEKFYDGTIFHRVVRKFIIQGGGYGMELRPKQTHEPILNEAYNLLKNEPGTVAMARTEDPDSATSQFFINLDENLFLNHYRPDPDYYGYCVFGRVVQGWDVVQRIANVPTGPVESFPSDVPLKPIMIETVRVVSAPPNLSPSPK